MATIPAVNLDEAQDLLDPRPLEFGETAKPRDIASDPRLYTEPPGPDHVERKRLGPMDKIRARLLRETSHTKLFLAGHVGSGKSTQVNRLAADPDIKKAFTVVQLQFEEQEWAYLDSAQVLFRMAGAIYEFAHEKKLLGESARWLKILRTLDEKVFGPSGLTAKEGSTGVEVNLLFLRLRQDLKLSETRRKQFRALGETQQSLLQDLLAELVDDLEGSLAKKGESGSLLMLVDDLDKVRGADAQRDIFDTNLNALLVPPLRVLYTLPTGVYFGTNRAELRQQSGHLYPVRILGKAPDVFDPKSVYLPDRMGFFHELLRHRVAPGLFDDESVRLAAIYSGGVLRDFFHLLREAILIARHNELDTVDAMTMREAVRDAQFRESAGLYRPDYEVFLDVHRTHSLRGAEHRHYLDESRVLECYNDEVWFEVTPLLWSLLERRARDAAAK
jgi:hypothetical protein